MRLAIVLPRNMHFGPDAATSIDLYARDSVLHSRHGADATILCEPVARPFSDCRTAPLGTSALARTPLGRAIDVARHVRARPVDLILVHQHLPSAAAIARLCRRTPVALAMHGMPKVLRGVRRTLKARRHGPLAGLVFVSEAAERAFAELYPDVALPRFVVPNGLDAAAWRADGARRAEIVSVGRVDPHKGSLEIAQALARVLPDHPGWRARFVGPLAPDKVFATRFREIIAAAPQIAYDGPVSQDAVRAIGLEAEIAIVASRREGFGRVAIEAFAAGNALISTVVDGLGEVVGDCALPLARGDADEIEAALRRLLADEGLRADLARRGRARFEARYTIEAFARAHDRAVEGIVAAAGSGRGR